MQPETDSAQVARRVWQEVLGIDRAYWHATGSERIGPREYFRRRRIAMKAFRRVAGFIDAKRRRSP
jgi:hypothetical protein